MKQLLLSILTAAGLTASALGPAQYVNPFIGTTNFGTCHPGAVTPNGLMSVAPFNVMGSDTNRYDKDKRWWSTPYDNTNSWLTGFSHINLSGVGCPEAASLLVMATTGPLQPDYHDYGTPYADETARPGYYANILSRYGIRAEVTATPRTSRLRFTLPAGQSNILLNLGEGLTNESGATVTRVSPTEVEGSKLLGTFCYNPGAVFPIYFVMRVSRPAAEQGYWKMQRPMQGVEAEWDHDNGRYKIYKGYDRTLSGDDIGVWYSYDNAVTTTLEVSIGVSFVSIENARLNLEAEQPEGTTFDQIAAQALADWDADLSRITVEGGTPEQLTTFYTALYHTLIHPSILSDVNGQYPAMESGRTMTLPQERDRYTVFSLWDTYRNLHQLLTLVYPERQTQMVQSMIDMYDENGWLPKWELFGRETLTMEGDPATAVIADTWLRGLHTFDIEHAYEAMMKGATTPGADNPLRPDADDYLRLGYVPLRDKFDNSVSHALEYYTADHALGRLAENLGHKEDARMLLSRAKGWRKYYDREAGTLRPLLPDGKFLTPFNPRQGADFEPVPGFHEGSAWNYTFAAPHDAEGMIRLNGGGRKFVEKLRRVFADSLYDPANEPDIVYPYLFSRVKGSEWLTHTTVDSLLRRCFTTAPDGLPGNDDTGTMSAWAVFSMMGIYPDTPGEPYFTITNPTFDRVTIKLDPEVWGRDSLVIEVANPEAEGPVLTRAEMGGKPAPWRVSQADLLRHGLLRLHRKP